LVPDLTDDLLQTVDCPLKVAVDPTNQRRTSPNTATTITKNNLRH
jgi:hypothetical protein